MRQKWLAPLVLSISMLLACSCPFTALPFLQPTPTPTAAATATPKPGMTVVAPTPPPLPSSDQAPFSIAWDDRSLFRQNLAPTAQGILSGMQGASIYHIAMSFSDPPTSMDGAEEIRYTNTENATLSEVDIAVFSEILGGSIDIHSLSVDGQSLEASHKNGIMRVTLPKPLEVGKSITFHIEFHVTIPDKGGGYYYGIFGYNDEILSLAHAYPTILVFNEQGWNNLVPDLDGDPLFSDASFYLVSINAPANLVLAASGVEVQRTEGNGRQTILYADGPARDFYLAASTKFTKQTVKDGEVAINTYTIPSGNTYAQSVLNNAKASVDDFSRRYAPYPYTEYDIVPIVTAALGVEFPGIVAIAEEAFGSTMYQEVVIVHETGHQWFYNLVGNETQGQPWLDESFAEFVTWQYYLDDYGENAAQTYQAFVKSKWDSVNDEKIPIGEAVPNYTSNEYVAIVYGRGPLFMIALRQQLGTATFDKLMKDYTEQFSWKIATTNDFKQLAEQECSCDLTPIFNEWVTP